MKHQMKIYRIFFMQLDKSRSVMLILLLVLTASLIADFLTDAWYFPYLMFGSGYLMAFLTSIAMVTTVHEGGHLSKLHELGFTAENFVAHRVGDVSFRIEHMEDLTLEECYRIAIAPYVQAGQYIVGMLFLALLIVINWYSPFPLNIILFLLTIVGCFGLMANFCAYFVIKTKRQSGFCVAFSRTITSRGDMDDVIAWHKKLLALDYPE